MTPKQQHFISEYLVELDATKAAIRAGYSHRAAAQIGYENLRKPHIAAAIQTAMAKRAERTEITQDYVLATIRDTIEQCKGTGEHSNPQAVLKGAELLGRHLAMFTDKTINKTTIESMTDDEIEARLAQLDKAKFTLVT